VEPAAGHRAFRGGDIRGARRAAGKGGQPPHRRLAGGEGVPASRRRGTEAEDILHVHAAAESAAASAARPQKAGRRGDQAARRHAQHRRAALLVFAAAGGAAARAGRGARGVCAEEAEGGYGGVCDGGIWGDVRDAWRYARLGLPCI